MIPDEGIQQIWIRYLLEDSYFGNQDFARTSAGCGRETRRETEKAVTGKEEIVTDMAYFRKSTVEKYLRPPFPMHASSTCLDLHRQVKCHVAV